MPVGPGSPVLGEYRLLERLGEGGMGTVYAAEHLPTGARRAVKVLPVGLDPEQVLRFQREAEAMARADGHPHVARIHAAGEDQGRRWLAMDLLPGGDLQARLRAGPLPPGDAARLVAGLARGVAHVHARGVLHRDLKPANVLFDEHGAARLVDFGLARTGDAGSLTASGTVLGTPAYMAPEQALGAAQDARTDVHGLGAILYECLTGRPPFGGGSVAQALARVVHEAPLRPGAVTPGVPPALERECLRALAKRPADRHPSAAALAEALERAASDTASARRGGWAGLAAASGAALVLGLAAAAPTAPADGGVDVAPAAPTPAAPSSSSQATSAEPPAKLPRGLTRDRNGELTHRRTGITFVWVAPGSFRMGDDDGDASDRPAHPVRLTSGFFLGKHEVTWKQYEAFCEGTKYPQPDAPRESKQKARAGDDHPVRYVTLQDAMAFCDWAKLRLPTEAEWEFAARGTDGRLYPWGNEPPSRDHGNFRTRRGSPTSPVGSFPSGAAPCGALDMAGNVWELVADRYGDYTRDAATDPTGPAGPRKGDVRWVARGGGYGTEGVRCRTSRRRTAGHEPLDDIGFRVACSAE